MFTTQAAAKLKPEKNSGWNGIARVIARVMGLNPVQALNFISFRL